MENKVATPHAGDIYTIIRAETAGPDDFAQAVNIGACAIWYTSGTWPNMAAIAGFSAIADRLPGVRPVTPAQMDAASPDVPWMDQYSQSGGMDSFFGIPGQDF